MKKNKLLHIQLLPLLSGVQNMMLNLVTALDPDKYEIHIISKPGGLLVQRIKELGFNYIPVPSLRRNLSPLDLAAFIHIFYILKKGKFDIVHTHSSKTGFIGRIAARSAGIRKIIHTAHGLPFNDFQSKAVRRFYIMLEKLAARFCDKIVFVNVFERELAVRKKIFNSEKTITIYNGINVPEKRKTSYYQKDGSRFIIGSIARFSKQKNVINLTKAAIEVCKRSSKIEFELLGDGEDLPVCLELVRKAGFEEKIRFPGWSHNVIEALLKFDVFILFSRWEGLPLSILEAMSVGLPIIASDIKGNNELVSDQNGILVDVDAVDELVEVLLQLPDKGEDLKRWGQNSLKIVEKRFELDRFVSEYKKLYENDN